MSILCKIVQRQLSLKRNFFPLTKMYYSSKKKDGDGKKGSDSEDDNEIKNICSVCGCDNPSTPTTYDSRKYGHNLPSNDICLNFDAIPNAPTGIFRCTVGEVLGRGAGKGCCYQCPEYFSYQHMSYYDLHLILRAYRNPSPKTGRKP